MTARGATIREMTDEELVVAWRGQVLVRAGYEPEDAMLIANDTTIDLHKAVEMLSSGCPPHLATIILV